MTRIRNSAPVDPNDRFVQQIKGLLQRVADLERRAAQRPAALPWGPVGYAQVTASQASITSVTDLTGLSVSWTAVAGRRYRITGSTLWFSSVAGDTAWMLVTDGSNTIVNLGGTVVDTTSARERSIERSRVISGLSGAQTHKLRGQRSSGSGSLTMDASSLAPAFILVEDIGPS